MNIKVAAFTVSEKSSNNNLFVYFRSEYGLCNGDNGKCRLVNETRPVLVWKYPVNLDMNVTYLELNQFVQFEWFEFASHCSCSNNHY